MKDTFHVNMRELQSFEDWFAGLDVSMEGDTHRIYLVTVTNANGVFNYKINCEFPDALRNLSDDEKLQVFKNALNKWIDKYRQNEGRKV